jgi:serine phosphatase RsbU (regulator of sigma subunit)
LANLRSLLDGAPRVRYVLQIAAVAAAYLATGKVGLDLAFATSSVTAIWPPTGIALAAIVLGGRRLWPGVALGAFLTNVDTGVPAYTVLGITVGNTLEALVGAWLLRRVAGFRPSLERVRDILALVGLGAVLSTMVSATIGVASLLAGGEVDFADTPSVWRTWWLGDMGGDLIVAPALLVAATHLRRAERPPGGRLEAVALTLAMAGVSVVVFNESINLAYLCFPPLIWAALRFWQPGAAGATLIMAAAGVWLTENGHGPFAGSGPDERLLLVETFVAVAGVTALVLAAVTSERRRVERTARAIASTLQDSLLPARLPTIPQLEVAALFRPAGAEQRVGGDFYDVFQAGDGSWALAVGDVGGKGPRAAAMTGLARYTLRAVAAREQRPGRVLQRLNEAIIDQQEDEFCTVAYARLELDGGRPRLTLASAGHPPPVAVRAAGEVQTLGISGLLLGLDPAAAFPEYELVLEAGDAVVFYTDGLTDAHAPARVVTTSELVELFGTCAGRPPREFIALAEQRLLDGDGRAPRDDVAVVVLSMTAPG